MNKTLAERFAQFAQALQSATARNDSACLALAAEEGQRIHAEIVKLEAEPKDEAKEEADS